MCFFIESSTFFSHICAFIFTDKLVEKMVQPCMEGVHWHMMHRDDMRHELTMYELLYACYYNHVSLIVS